MRLTSDGTAYCWGWNANGQLGRTANPDANPNVDAVNTPLRFAHLVAGGYHTCGVQTTGTLYCWGGNASGQLRDGTTVDRPAPVAVVGQTFQVP